MIQQQRTPEAVTYHEPTVMCVCALLEVDAQVCASVREGSGCLDMFSAYTSRAYTRPVSKKACLHKFALKQPVAHTKYYLAYTC